MSSQAIAAAKAAIRCPFCDTDWTGSSMTSTEICRLPTCGHAVCLGCYATRSRLATDGGVSCPACGVVCRERPDRLPADAAAAVKAIGRLLALLTSQKATEKSKTTFGGSVPVQLLQLTQPSYAPVYLAKRRALLCLLRDCNNQKIEAVDSDTGQHVASLALEGLREDRTITSLCLRRQKQQQRYLLAADRYRDRLHVVDLATGRCLQTFTNCRRPRCLWADEGLALVSERDGRELTVLAWDDSHRLQRLGSVASVSGRPLADIRSAVSVGGSRAARPTLLLSHGAEVSSLDRRQLLRRLRRAAEAPGSGGQADAPACDAPADDSLKIVEEFGLADCSDITVGCACDSELAGQCGDCILFLAGRDQAAASAAPTYGIRVIRRRGTDWKLAASVSCRCRCGLCSYSGCARCQHQPRLPVDGLAFDDSERRLFAVRRGSGAVQIVRLPEPLLGS